MSNLTLFQRKLNSSNVISLRESATIKGGIRFVESGKELGKLLEKLENSGIKFTMEKVKEGWCIDW
jgi:hypothetical protein